MAMDTATHLGQQIARMRARLGDAPVLVGPSAALALGFRSAVGGERDARVHVAGVSPRRTATLVAHRLAMSPEDVIATSDGLCTSPVRTAVGLARGLGTGHLGVDQRVALLDGFLYSVRLPVADARIRASVESGLWGLFTGRRVLSLARDGVQSPKETELRLLLRRQGWPEAVVQCPVVSRAGNVVAHLDLGWPEYRVGVEYDGARIGTAGGTRMTSTGTTPSAGRVGSSCRWGRDCSPTRIACTRSWEICSRWPDTR